MSLKIGKTVKVIRIGKGIKAINLYNSILSKQAAIKFESGQNDTTVSKFFLILDRLNISLEEFEQVYRNDNNSDFYFTSAYIKKFYQKDIAGLKNLIEKANLEYKKTLSEKYIHYSALIQLLIDYILDENPCLISQKIIIDYLNKCDNWGYYEITLFTNTLFSFSGEYIDSVYARVKKRFNDYSQLLRYRNEMALLIFNILEKKLLEKDLYKIKFYLDELKNIKKSTLDNMYIQTMIKYFTILSEAILKNQFTIHTHKEIDKIITMFNFIELPNKAEQCQSFYLKFKKSVV